MSYILNTMAYASNNASNTVQNHISLLDQLVYRKRIFIKGLKTSVNQRDMINYLRNFGNDNEFAVELTTNKNKKHRGFAFVNISSQNMYNKVMNQEHTIAGAKLEISDAKTKEKIIDEEKKLKEDPRKIFYGGISHDTTKEQLLAYFEKYGEIEDLNLTFKRENKGKGFGFLLFKNGDSMKKVLDDFNDHSINGCWFECQLAKPKFAENYDGNEADHVVEIAMPRRQSDDSKLSILRDPKNFQQNSKELDFSNMKTKSHSPDQNSKLDISLDKIQCKLDNVALNLKENILLEKTDSKSEKVTEQKTQRKSLISLKQKMIEAKLRTTANITTDDFNMNFIRSANTSPQFDCNQLASNQMNFFPNISTQNNITNYINQYNTGFSLKQINSIQAPPGLEPVPERRKSHDMPSELYDSLQNQEMI